MRLGAIVTREMDAAVDYLLRESEGRGLLAISHEPSMQRALGRRLKRGNLVMPHKGMYAHRSYWEGLSWAVQAMSVLRTYALVHPDAVFCSFSAALIHGLWVPKREALERVHVFGSHGCRTPWVHFHKPSKIGAVSVSGFSVASLERTALDCMADLEFRNSLAIADSYLRRSGREPYEARDEFESLFPHCPGIVQARRVLPLADARSENGGESYARAVMIENDIMLPELQHVVTRPDGSGGTYRFDYFWDLVRRKVGGELDGYCKTEDPAILLDRSQMEVLRDERMRESDLTALGYQIVRFTFDMAVRTFPLLERLEMFGIPHGEQFRVIH